MDFTAGRFKPAAHNGKSVNTIMYLIVFRNANRRLNIETV